MSVSKFKFIQADEQRSCLSPLFFLSYVSVKEIRNQTNPTTTMSDVLQYELNYLRFEQSYNESTQTIDDIINHRASQQRRMDREEIPFNDRPMLITL